MLLPSMDQPEKGRVKGEKGEKGKGKGGKDGKGKRKDGKGTFGNDRGWGTLNWDLEDDMLITMMLLFLVNLPEFNDHWLKDS